MQGVDQLRVNADSPRVDFVDLYRHNFDQLVRLANLRREWRDHHRNPPPEDVMVTGMSAGERVSELDADC